MGKMPMVLSGTGSMSKMPMVLSCTGFLYYVK